MKKVGIITIHKINNYGAVEQAYALNKFLRDNNFSVKTIDFQTYRVKESYKIFEKIKSPMDIIRNLYSLFHLFKISKRGRKFDSFVRKNIPVTDKSFFSNDELENANFDFDYYICGSDQIWNTYCQNYSDAFILSFAKGKNRISYAASLGAESINECLIDKFREELSEFNAISVRESNAISVISEISNQKVTHVIDPVFLLNANQWNDVGAKLKFKRPYIFFYSVHGDIPGMRDFVKEMSKVLKLDIIVVNKNLREALYKNKKFYDAGPADFISLIKNAEFVCTNSFHAVSFSIIFKKKFWVFTDAVKTKSGTSSRILSVLKSFGLEDRIVSKKFNDAFINQEIDYNKVYKLLKPFIEDSKSFLLNSLGERYGNM